MSNNREFSQLASFINVDETNNFIGIATDGTQLVGIGTSSITLDGRTGIISATAFYASGQNLTDLIGTKIEGITVEDEGTPVGTAGSIATLNIVGSNVTATATTGANGIATITFTDPNYASNAGISTNIKGGDSGDIPYQTSADTTSFIDASTASPGQVILWNGSDPYWGDLSGASGFFGGITVEDEGTSVGTAGSIATLNIVGSNVTATATTGANGIATITFTDPNYASNAGISTNIKGGDSGDIPYQTSADTTSFIDASTVSPGKVLLFNGSIPIWGDLSGASGFFGGITVYDEGTPVGTAGSIATLNIVGSNVTATATTGANGIATITVADYVSNAGVATALKNSRTFEITGDVVASSIAFDGTGNVSLAATIQPNSVGLGTDTFGDYVKDIIGTSNQITVTGGTGEGSSPTLSIPSQFTVPQDLTVLRDVQIDRNLNVNGNITIGGTSATIFSQELKVFDSDIVLGFRTDAFGNDVSTDNTANHGGIAVASTEGNPLVQLFIAGIETNPATYKKIMWFKAGSFAGLNTDAWLSNYAIGIGSTQFPSGTRLAAGSVQFTENDLAVVRDINASGIITGTLANDLTLDTSGNGISGVATYNNSGNVTFTVTSDATSANTAETIVYRDGSGNFSAGTITANLTGTATTATNLANASGITTGTISSDRLSGTYNINISGNAGTATTATNVIGGIASVTSLDVSGVSTLTQLSVNSSTGTNGQYLKATGSGLAWESFPTIRSTTNFNATASQTTFSVSYEIGYIDVYINGIRISDSEFTATNGTSVILDTPCFGGEEVTVISYNTTSTGGSFANANYSGIVTATGGFSSGTGSPVEISVVGSTLIFNIAGIGSTTLTLS